MLLSNGRNAVIHRNKTVHLGKRRHRSDSHRYLVRWMKRRHSFSAGDAYRKSAEDDITIPLQGCQRRSVRRRYLVRRERQWYNAHLRELVRRGMERDIGARIPICKRLDVT